VSGRDIGASVRQRLLNKSRTQGRPFQELLQYFAMERFLYRLAKSPYSDRFVLKGALLLTAWRAPQSRPTMDIDLAARVNNQLDHIKEVVATVCEVDVQPDGIAFNRTSNRDQPDQRGRGLRRCPSPVPRNARESANSNATRYRVRRCHYSRTHGH
jgi:nucleotidyltransferase AbiEii toxin of type IV toxin-antitoxin system